MQVKDNKISLIITLLHRMTLQMHWIPQIDEIRRVLEYLRDLKSACAYLSNVHIHPSKINLITLTVTSPILATCRKKSQKLDKLWHGIRSFLKVHLAYYFLSHFERVNVVWNKVVVARLAKLSLTFFFYQIHVSPQTVMVLHLSGGNRWHEGKYNKRGIHKTWHLSLSKVL